MPIDANDLFDDKVDQLEFTSVRIHELALQRWLYKAFPLQDGYPTPIIFATPRDAHSEFVRLFKAGNNPFAYLLNLKDERGQPIYAPHPSNVFYPLLTVKRLNWRFRANQNCGYHVNRRVYYPTTSQDASAVRLNDLALAAQTQMPSAWDFRYQINYLCKTPFTQAVFVNRLKRKLWAGGGVPQTFIVARYPFPHGNQYIRLYLESDIESITEEGDNENNQEMRISFNVVLEGWSVDYKTRFSPVMWYLGREGEPVSPFDLDTYFSLPLGLEDVRVDHHNPAIDSRKGLPLESNA